MRWLFLLLLILNVFYYVWHQQQSPMQATEVASLTAHRSSQQDIHLLSEAGKPGETEQECLYMGGYQAPGQLAALQQRLSADKSVTLLQHIKPEQGGGYWLRIGVPGQPLPDAAAIKELSQGLDDLKHQILPCEGIATSD